MTYQEQEDILQHKLEFALSMLNSALLLSGRMVEQYGQQEYGRNEDILEAYQMLKSIVEKF